MSQNIKKMVQNAAFHGIGSKFSDKAFCLPHHLVSFLFGHRMRSPGYNTAVKFLRAVFFCKCVVKVDEEINSRIYDWLIA